MRFVAFQFTFTAVAGHYRSADDSCDEFIRKEHYLTETYLTEAPIKHAWGILSITGISSVLEILHTIIFPQELYHLL